MSADQLPTRKLTQPQAQLLAYMKAGAVPTLRMGIPGETVSLGPWEQNWRTTHGGSLWTLARSPAWSTGDWLGRKPAGAGCSRSANGCWHRVRMDA